MGNRLSPQLTSVTHQPCLAFFWYLGSPIGCRIYTAKVTMTESFLASVEDLYNAFTEKAVSKTYMCIYFNSFMLYFFMLYFKSFTLIKCGSFLSLIVGYYPHVCPCSDGGSLYSVRGSSWGSQRWPVLYAKRADHGRVSRVCETFEDSSEVEAENMAWWLVY